MDLTPEGIRMQCLQLAVGLCSSPDGVPGITLNARAFEAFVRGVTVQTIEAEVAEKIAA